MMHRLLIGLFLPLSLVSCSWDPNGIKAQQKWLEEKKAEKIAYDKQLVENQAQAAKSQALEKENFEKSHPEVLVNKEKFGTGSSTGDDLKNALYSFDFVTRYPSATTADNAYVHVGRALLTARAVSNSITAYMAQCNRVSAYTGDNYKQTCTSVLAKGINDFTSVLKDRKIPALTKQAALSEATFGDLIDFEHAARLARMHTSLCEQQGNKGYVSMVTISAPCSGYKGAGIEN
ncbi:hypothetical protein [Pantoea ananatis]|uniref:hypothetical protein n=1 Tax=Pantoea ananas TaxID=553 RepID=UPI0005C6237E|nr:hypothetical protein [Pantoea ananatis]